LRAYFRLSPEARMKGTHELPWGYVRSQLASRWCVPPWEVDEAPAHEVALALRMAAIEAEESDG
jgi:hypothetical protein